jgi:hypothetical protein
MKSYIDMVLWIIVMCEYLILLIIFGSNFRIFKNKTFLVHIFLKFSELENLNFWLFQKKLKRLF